MDREIQFSFHGRINESIKITFKTHCSSATVVKLVLEIVNKSAYLHNF